MHRLVEDLVPRSTQTSIRSRRLKTVLGFLWRVSIALGDPALAAGITDEGPGHERCVSAALAMFCSSRRQQSIRFTGRVVSRPMPNARTVRKLLTCATADLRRYPLNFKLLADGRESSSFAVPDKVSKAGQAGSIPLRDAACWFGDPRTRCCWHFTRSFAQFFHSGRAYG